MNIEIEMGKLAIGKMGDNLITHGLGSCLAIMLYEPKLKIGALAHVMLSNYSSSESLNESQATRYEVRDTRYINTAIEQMVAKMAVGGAEKQNIEAKIVGGANMFPTIGQDLGKENVLSAKKKLKQESVKLIGECVGGSIGRSVEFSIATGIVTVKTKF